MNDPFGNIMFDELERHSTENYKSIYNKLTNSKNELTQRTNGTSKLSMFWNIFGTVIWGVTLFIIIQFIPQGDIPYYRGVVQRGASVYFCEYALEQRNRELEELDRELLEDVGGKTLLSDAEVDNNKVNDVIYKEINSLKYSAFINLLLIPVIVLVMVFLFFIIMFIIRVFT